MRQNAICGLFAADLILVAEDHTPMNDSAASLRPAPTTASVASERLKTFIERIERLEEDKANVANDIREVYAEAKGEGYDAKVMRKLVTLRKKDPHQRREEEELLELYLAAIGE